MFIQKKYAYCICAFLLAVANPSFCSASDTIGSAPISPADIQKGNESKGAPPGVNAGIIDETQNDLTVKQMERGRVVLRDECIGSKRYVSANVLIHEPPEKIWPVLANPYEFHKGIFSRMQDLDVTVDEPEISCMKTRINCGMFPSIDYVVESRYLHNQRIDFKRKEGIFRDFNGYWLLTPNSNRTDTVVTFALFVDPGIPLPQWLIRQAIKIELPKTLRKLRRRVVAVCNLVEPPVDRSIVAAGIKQAN